MKSSQKLSILLWKKMSKQRKADGKIPIYARITVERGGSREVSTRIWLLPENWDVENKSAILSESEMLEKGNGGSKELKKKERDLDISNRELLNVVTELEDHFKVLKITNGHVSAAMLKSSYEGESQPNNEAAGSDKEDAPAPSFTLLDAADDFITNFEKLVAKKLRSADTLKHWKTTRNKLKSFIQFQFKQEDIAL